MHHVYYGNPKQLDLNKIRQEAEIRRRGDKYNKEGRPTIIHHHKHEDKCDSTTVHEEYRTE